MAKQEHSQDGRYESYQVEDLSHVNSPHAALGIINIIKSWGNHTHGDQTPAGGQETQKCDGINSPAEANAVEEAQDPFFSSLTPLFAHSVSVENGLSQKWNVTRQIGPGFAYPNMLDVAIDIERVPEIPDLLCRGLHVEVLPYPTNGLNSETEWQELRRFSNLVRRFLSPSLPLAESGQSVVFSLDCVCKHITEVCPGGPGPLVVRAQANRIAPG